MNKLLLYVVFCFAVLTTAVVLADCSATGSGDAASAQEAPRTVKASAGAKNAADGPEASEASSVYDFTVQTIEGKQQSLSQYQGKVLLIVNTASKCGYTPQYEDFQKLYEAHKDEGLVVLGFPSNDFNQEPGDEERIQQFCQEKFNVTFPMFSKVHVKGEQKHPLYEYLTNKQHNGQVDAKVKWNFFKFLVNRKGQPVSVYPSPKKVTSDQFQQKLKALLDQ
jgi:glutathione peroxidase